MLEIIMKLHHVLLLSIVFALSVLAQNNAPKREFRGAWLSTVANIDWPKSNNVETQKRQLIEILDYLKDANLNAVIMQVRPSCDALYASEIEPWSNWLTGKQGTPPEPFYDPLELAIEEAHKRGMELHAWFNPYRIKYDSWSFSLDPKNVAVQHPEWVLNIGGDLILDPGLPEVRQHVTDVVMDVVRRYDVDAIHFDDYFYIEGISSQDNETYANHSRGFTNKSDWRRDNVHELLRQIYAAIQAEKPHVKFGQSPRGIWKNGVPAGTTGANNYSDIYCDAVTWLDEQIIDYLAPQLYWRFGGGQDYAKLMPWWVSVRNERHIYPGLAYYRVGTSSFDKTQLGKMVSLNRGNDGCQGEIYFTSHDFRDNHEGNTDTLKNNYYKYPALPPVMDWKETTIPLTPVNLRFDKMPGTASTGLNWQIQEEDEANKGRFSVVYVFDSATPSADDIANPANIISITGNDHLFLNDVPVREGDTYVAVSVVDKNNNESEISNILDFNISVPEIPTLAFPLPDAINQRDTIVLTWNYAQNASSYTLQVFETDDMFTPILNIEDMLDSTYTLTDIEGMKSYSWRVKAKNISGETEFSPTISFTTGFPVATTLVSPPTETFEVPENTTFVWNRVEGATYYRLQIVKSVLSWSENLIVVDETNINDTTFTLSELLDLGEFYSWRIIAGNDYGESQPSEIFKFQTNLVSSVELIDSNIPTEYSLYQNYPNPFNPSTQINFDIPQANFTSIKVFNALGQQIETLVNDELAPGRYTVSFDASYLPSGIYIYTLSSGETKLSKKMMFVK
jgi:uncharacterized lipoprotein YddW (UPF0748 family)